MVDFHVLLRDGMTLEGLLQKSRRDGIFCGVIADSAQLKNDTSAQRWLSAFAGKPAFTGLSVADPNWTRSISRATARQFDYVIADSRRWMNTAAIPSDRGSFVEALVDRTVERLGTEPIDIYSFPTYLPAEMKSDADTLWTASRKTKLIEALVKNNVAVELNSRDELPDVSFVEQAKEAGCKFAFGTGNETSAELKRCEYGLQMVKTCKLDWQNFYAPGSWWPKATERHWPS